MTTLAQAKTVLAETAPIDEVAVRAFRLGRIRRLLASEDVAGLILFDPVNIRYACGARNMQVWTMHNFCRYLFVGADGRVVHFELAGGAHLARDLETIDEIRPALSFDFVVVGPRGQEMAGRFAAELADLACAHGRGSKRILIDRADLVLVRALDQQGLEPIDGKPLIERARSIKSHEEIRALVASLRTCEDSVAAMRAQLRHGMRESDALSFLLKESVARGGEYPETRLLASGPRTNPWFQETSDRVMSAGDLLAFDTDLIGPMGFYNDISRSWTVEDTKPTDEQRRLYDMSRHQISHNIDLLRPGTGLLEFGEKAFELPGEFIENRYADMVHGCGLGVEYPFVWYPQDAEWGAYDGVFETDMIVCVESYVGRTGGAEGVKLEQPVWITDDGPLLISDYPLEDDYA